MKDTVKVGLILGLIVLVMFGLGFVFLLFQ